MKLRVLYFARLRERFGLAEENVELAGTTATDLVAVVPANSTFSSASPKRSRRRAKYSTRSII